MKKPHFDFGFAFVVQLCGRDAHVLSENWRALGFVLDEVGDGLADLAHQKCQKLRRRESMNHHFCSNVKF